MIFHQDQDQTKPIRNWLYERRSAGTEKVIDVEGYTGEGFDPVTGKTTSRSAGKPLDQVLPMTAKAQREKADKLFKCSHGCDVGSGCGHPILDSLLAGERFDTDDSIEKSKYKAGEPDDAPTISPYAKKKIEEWAVGFGIDWASGEDVYLYFKMPETIDRFYRNHYGEIEKMAPDKSRKEELTHIGKVLSAADREGKQSEPEWCECGQVKGHDNGEPCNPFPKDGYTAYRETGGTMNLMRWLAAGKPKIDSQAVGDEPV